MEEKVYTPIEVTLSTFDKLINIYSKSYPALLFRNIDLVSAIYNITVEEIENLPISQFKDMVEVASNIDISLGKDLTKTITVDGVEYGTRAYSTNNFTFNVKEVVLLQELFIAKKDSYLAEIAAVLYHPIVDGKLVLNYDEKAILERKFKFLNLPVTAIDGYLSLLTDFIKDKYE